MTWLVLSGFTALFYALGGGWCKFLLKKENAKFLVLINFLSSTPLVALPLFWEGLPEIKAVFFPAVLISVAVNAVAVTLLFIALKEGDLSLVYPLLSFTPIFVVGTEWLIYGVVPSANGLYGILAIVVGTYILHTDSGRIFGAFFALWQNRASRYALIVSLLWSITAIADKVAVTASSPAFYLTFFHIVFVLLYFPVARKESKDSFSHWSFKRFLFFAILGVLDAGMALSQMHALRLTLVSYVIAIKRTGALLTVLIGGFAFKEKAFLRRLIGALLMTAGVWLISI